MEGTWKIGKIAGLRYMRETPYPKFMNLHAGFMTNSIPNFICIQFMTIYDLFKNEHQIYKLVLDLRPLYTPLLSI